jgi:hypothetical protein
MVTIRWKARTRSNPADVCPIKLVGLVGRKVPDPTRKVLEFLELRVVVFAVFACIFIIAEPGVPAKS